MVGVLGVIDDVARRVPSGWQDEGNNIYLLGVTKTELDGSAWAGTLHDHLGGRPPVVDLPREAALGALLHAGAMQGLLASAHDLADGGLAQALAEAVMRFGVGARVWLDELMLRDGIDLTTALFSESTGRVIVSVPREDDVKFMGLCEGREYPVLRIGVTDSGAGVPSSEQAIGVGALPTIHSDAALDIQGHFSIGVADLYSAHRATLPARFGATVA